MATPDLALLRAGYRELTRCSSEFACSYDLDGNIIEINGVLERLSGYSRDEALGMNLRQLLDAESWELSREQVREQVGGGPPQNLNINVVTKDGQHVQVEITRRLLFEQGRPVAVLDRGVSTSEAVTWHNEAALHEVEERLSLKSMELAQFTEQLKQLHRLSTTSYPALERAFDDHLSTGSRLFDLAVGMILRVEGGTAVVHAVHGSPDLRAGKEIPLRSTHCLTVAGRLRTTTASEPVAGDELYTEFEIYIGTPIWAGCELFGTLSFSSTFEGVPRLFTAAEREVVELMARSLGRCVLEHRVHSERKKSESLEKSRNRVLEMVAENHALENILDQVGQMVA